MGVINVKTTSLTEVGDKLKRLTNNVDAIGKGFSSVRSLLDSDVKGKSGIGNDMKNSSDDLNNIEKVLRNASRYIDEVVKSYSGDERRLAQFVAKMNLKAVSERSCSSVTEIMLEAMYYGAKGWEAVQAIVQSGFFGDTGTISSDLSYSRELLFAKSNTSGTAKIDKVNSVPAKAYIQQEKELSWDEVLEYAAYNSSKDRERVEKVKEMLEIPNIPFEAKKSMIEALRPQATKMWSILEASPIPSDVKDKIKSNSSKTDQDTKNEGKIELPFEYEINHIPLDSVTLPVNDKGESISRRSGEKLQKLEYITIHSTGNPNSYSDGERGWLLNPNNFRQASFHIVVDENKALEVIPLDEVAIHASSYTGNRTSIGIEICHSGDREKTLENAIILTAKLLQDNNLNTSHLRRHFDWNGKNCPSILIDPSERDKEYQTWEWFINEVDKKLK